MKKLVSLRNKKGFTLVELIIVIAIIAVLAAVVAPQYIKYVEKSKAAVDYNALDSVLNAALLEVVDPAYVNTVKDGTLTVTIDSDHKIVVGDKEGAVSGIKDGVKAIIDTSYVMKSKKGQALTGLEITVNAASGKCAWTDASKTAIDALLAN